MNRHDEDGILFGRSGDRLVATRLHPPIEESREVAALGLYEFEHQVAEGLQEGAVLLSRIVGQQGDEFLGHLIEGTMSQFWMEGTLRLVELEIFFDGLFGCATIELEETAPGNGTEDV